MESVKKELLIGGALVLAAAGAYAYLSTPRGEKPEEKSGSEANVETQAATLAAT